MKKIALTITLFIAINSFGQINTEKGNGLKITNQVAVSENDTIIKVYYENQLENNIKPAYFVNDKLVDESVLKTLNPNEIENVKVEKDDIEIDNVKYYGKILVETKSTYSPNFISLNNLKTKYTNIKENKIIFKIDNEIVNANYDNFIVDEKYILKIVVENYENKEEKLKVCFINLFTKSEENIKESKEILLRGKDEFEINKN